MSPFYRICCVLSLTLFLSKVKAQQLELTDSIFARKIFDTALTNSSSYHWLEYLSNRIGGRLSGSVNAKLAVDYTKSLLDSLRIDNVWIQPVLVTKWIRGLKEYAYLELPKSKTTTAVSISAFGGSIPTPPLGVMAETVEVKTFEELKEKAMTEIQGKIVFYNHPMDPKLIDTFEAYSEISKQGRFAIKKASEFDAVGVIIRSMTLKIDDVPHTDIISYEGLPKHKHIPVASISTSDADMLSSLLTLTPNLKFYFKQNCKTLGSANSHNVIGEIKGSQYPEKIILVGAHLDSWDIGNGSHDNGAGVVQSIGVLDIFKKLNYKPRHTIRVVLFANKENGGNGAKEYTRIENQNKKNHVFALESDVGGFTPRGFVFDCTGEQFQRIKSWSPLLDIYGLGDLKQGNSKADIATLKGGKTILARLKADSQRYFDLYHSENDTFESINKRELELGQAAMTLLIYLVDKYEW